MCHRWPNPHKAPFKDLKKNHYLFGLWVYKEIHVSAEIVSLKITHTIYTYIYYYQLKELSKAIVNALHYLFYSF